MGNEMIPLTITGLGCDIEEIDRFCLDKTTDAGFLRKVFTSSECEYCFAFDDPAPHLAARFCAKEAVVKALCSAGEPPVDYGSIEIGNNPSGVPFVTILADTQNNHGQRYEIRVSISHCRTTAMAVVIISRIPPQESPADGHPDP